MSKKLYDELKEIIETDEPQMTPSIRYAWYGYLSALYNYGHLTPAEEDALSSSLQLEEGDKKEVYDALSGGIIEREQ